MKFDAVTIASVLLQGAANRGPRSLGVGPIRGFLPRLGCSPLENSKSRPCSGATRRSASRPNPERHRVPRPFGPLKNPCSLITPRRSSPCVPRAQRSAKPCAQSRDRYGSWRSRTSVHLFSSLKRCSNADPLPDKTDYIRAAAPETAGTNLSPRPFRREHPARARSLDETQFLCPRFHTRAMRRCKSQGEAAKECHAAIETRLQSFAIWPWSCNNREPASNAPLLARGRTGICRGTPCTQIPSRVPASTTGAMPSISCGPADLNRTTNRHHRRVGLAGQPHARTGKPGAGQGRRPVTSMPGDAALSYLSSIGRHPGEGEVRGHPTQSTTCRGCELARSLAAPYSRPLRRNAISSSRMGWQNPIAFL